MSAFFDWLVDRQRATIDNPAKTCKAKVSLIAHSMGNYVVQKAMAAAWTRKNRPLLVSLLNQLVMVAADVDSDLFDMGAPDNNDGNAVANLTYRITTLYSGRDSVLGASAGLKHFGGVWAVPVFRNDRLWQIRLHQQTTCGTLIAPPFSHRK